jgi:hypothetical protein
MSDTSKFGFSPEILSLPNQQEYTGETFPLALGVKAGDIKQACEWIAENAEQTERQAATHGAVLIRGLPLSTPDDFDAAVVAFGLPNFTYEDSLSNAVRVVYTPRVFSANEAPPETTIFLHHEMAQTPVYPSKLFFFCQKAAEEGGFTPLCRSDVLWGMIDEKLPRFAQNCLTKGLKYSNVMPAEADLGSGMGRSWQSTLSVDSREGAEARLSELGYSWEWMEQDELRVTSPTLPAVRELGNGKRSFFNQLIAAFKGWKDSRNNPSKSITYGDASPLDPSEIERVCKLADEITFDLPWQDGDLALVDNYLCMHGRRSFKGTRKVLASLIAA